MPTRGAARSALREVAMPLAASAICVFVVGACLVTDPPGELDRLPERRPTILRSAVVPPTTAVITVWPDYFSVPVEISYPEARIYWAAFIDYDPVRGEGFVDWDYDQASNGTRTRLLPIPIKQPTSDRCHTVEIVVGVDPVAPAAGLPSLIHTPIDPPGGDSVTWFYNPMGNAAGCPSLDAGIDAPLREGGEGGPQ